MLFRISLSFMCTSKDSDNHNCNEWYRLYAIVRADKVVCWAVGSGSNIKHESIPDKPETNQEGWLGKEQRPIKSTGI